MSELSTLHERAHSTGDARALESLAAFYDDEARRLARRRGTRRSAEDLLQVAREGLILALRRFDPALQRPFLPFARATIDGMILRYLRDQGYSIRPSRKSYELTHQINVATEMLTSDLRRHPTNQEIADLIGLPVHDVLRARASLVARTPVSLDGPSDDAGQSDLYDRIGGPDDSIDRWLDSRTLAWALQQLTPAERSLLQAYILEGRTQADIAHDLGASQMSVSRQLRDIYRKLRSLLEPTYRPSS